MAKQSTAFALPLLPRAPGEPAARWLCEALRSAILDGRLRPGARLPPSRDLARQHGLSRGTIVTAFERLASEGYVQGTVGSGTYVSLTLPEELLQVARQPAGGPPRPGPAPRRLSTFARRAREFPQYSVRPTRAFRTDLPALDLFPTTLWAQLAGRRLRRATTSLLMGCPPQGYRPLQEAVAEYLAASRGVHCAAEQVAIVSGVQQALELTGRVVLNPGDPVCMENPGYPGAALAFEAAGARMIWVGVDGEGMLMPSSGRRRLAYVTPGHQFPLGISMSLARRLALLEWARVSRALIFEDDYDSEFRYAGRPVPALQSLDRHGVVLFAGSFSKVLFPSLRLGYLVIPADLVDRFAAVLSLSSRHAPLLEQAILCDFIAEGHFGRHIRRMREVYAERLSVLLKGARRHLDGLLDLIGVEAGLQMAGWLREGIDEGRVTAAAARREVDVTPLSRYVRTGRRVDNGGRPGLQLGFAAVDPEEIRRGVRELGIALEEARVRD
ncbi:MAG TPA: PLP-dependent aminotransferase family protein [Gemmatimonadales bacterium]|nr:PLP-dependent aminotransferase family protein [Gemmatimonadales bacterium]